MMLYGKKERENLDTLYKSSLHEFPSYLIGPKIVNESVCIPDSVCASVREQVCFELRTVIEEQIHFRIRNEIRDLSRSQNWSYDETS